MSNLEAVEMFFLGSGLVAWGICVLFFIMHVLESFND